MNPLPVVLVHGIRVTGSMWRPQIARLSPARRVAAPDLPGHGRRAAETFTLPAAVAAVAEAIDSVGGRALLAGISLGGYSAIATAAAHPDKVAGLVAIGCTTVPRPEYAGRYRMLARATGRRGQRLQYGVLRLRLGRQAADAACAGGLYPAAIPDVIDAVCAGDVLADLAAYPGWTRLVNGNRDAFRLDESRFLAAQPKAKLVIVPGAGHLVSLTHPEAISRLLETSATQQETESNLDIRDGQARPYAR